MDKDLTVGASSADPGIWTWIILAALLVIGVLIAIGSLALITVNQEPQLPTESQPAPPR